MSFHSVAKVKNAHDRKRYVISTTQNQAAVWETAVFPTGFFGVPKLTKPLLVENSHSAEAAQETHLRTTMTVEERSPDEWKRDYSLSPAKGFVIEEDLWAKNAPDWWKGDAQMPWFDDFQKRQYEYEWIMFQRDLSRQLGGDPEKPEVYVHPNMADKMQALWSSMTFHRVGKDDLFDMPARFERRPTEGRLERALDGLLKSFATYPPAYANWYYLGVCTREMGQSEMSAQAFKRFLREHQRWTSGGGPPEFKMVSGVEIWCGTNADMLAEATTMRDKGPTLNGGLGMP